MTENFYPISDIELPGYVSDAPGRAGFRRLMRALDVIDQGNFELCKVQLRVSDDDTRIYACRLCLRLLPGRRLTALANSDGKRYVIKIFPQRRRSLREYKQEVEGYELLRTASIEVPARVYHGPAEGKLNIIVYKYIGGARLLSDMFADKADAKCQQVVLKKFAELLSRLHHSGLVHEDPHLGNFLVKSDIIIVLDAGAVQHAGDKTAIEKNYGFFVAQFPVSWRLGQIFLDSYIGVRKTDKKYIDSLQRQVESMRHWREHRYLKKIYRECGAFHVIPSLFGKTVINRDYTDMGLMKLLDDPARVFDGDNTVLLKEGNSSTVGVVKVGGIEFVVKRYNIKNRAHRLQQTLKESRASRSWRNAHRLLLRGFLTAQPVAMVEHLKGGLKGVSLFIMLKVPGIHSADYFRRQDIGMDKKREMAAKMLGMISELHRENILHGDLKSTNFIIREEGPVIIDLDAMRIAGRQSSMAADIEKEMRRFRENWVEDPEPDAIFGELAPLCTRQAGS